MKKLLYLIIPLTLISCNQDFLDVKPSSNTVVPTTLDDFQQLLDASLFRYAPELLDVQSDDYYLQNTYFQSMSNVVLRNAHIWAEDIYEGVESEMYGWNTLYEQIFYANVVLDGLAKLPADGKDREYRSHVQGSALFLRAMALHYLVQLYAPAYDIGSASSDLAVPVPLSSDVNEKVRRESVDACYKRIMDDLHQSVPLLREQVDFSRPTKAAAYGLLARVYLMKGDYPSALDAADNSLQLYDDLTDFSTNVKIRDHKKSIYLTFMAPGTIVRSNSNNTLIDADLYRSYGDNDLRKTLFFRLGNQGLPIKIDFYGLSIYNFSGLDTDEQYLIRAECHARLDDTDEAMDALNHLLRYLHRDHIDRSASTGEEALELILQERRKQLIFRGLRWSDLKRFNRDGADMTLRRTLGDRTYTLPPNSPKWLFPIPANEIRTSAIPQNDR